MAQTQSPTIDLKDVLREVAYEKEIEIERWISALEDAMASAAKKQHRIKEPVRATFDPETNSFEAFIVKPPDFDPSKKYPVLVYVYGEPHSQTVLDRWGTPHADYHRAVAELGYLVVSIDNRGTPSPKGAAWRRAVAGSLGPLSTEEQAKGLKERIITWRHILRNAILPVVTVIGLSIPTLVAGALFIETIYSWPGMGSLFVEAVAARDYPMVMGIMLLSAVVVLLAKLLTDLAYGLVDPRIRYE